MERVEDTARVIERNPPASGSAASSRASRRLSSRDRPTPTFVSHTTPLTVAAELGAIGLALYCWLLLGGVRLIASVHRGDPALGLALGASFLALFVHALHSGFLEDPLTWLVLGIAAAFASGMREPAAAASRAGARARRATAGRPPRRPPRRVARRADERSPARHATRQARGHRRRG